MSLSGIRVLDLTRVLAGPYCTMMLAELGANVIKVEDLVGDELRGTPPMKNGESGYFFSVNRSKRSIAINLKTEGGKQTVWDLTRQSDVVVLNFGPGVPQRLGVDYQTLAAINPSIVYCSITGFGESGPYRDRRAYDPILQAMSGLMSVTGPRDGEPVKCGVPVTDIFSGSLGAFSIVTSLYRREKTGQGQYIELSMLDSTLAMMTMFAGIYFFTGEIPTCLGSEHPLRVPSANYPTSDGRYIHIQVNDRQWPKFCELLATPEMADDPDFNSMAQRVANRDRVNAMISAQLCTKTADEWDKIFDEAGIPAGPVNTIDRALENPHVMAREVVKTMFHPNTGPVNAIEMPYRFAKAGTAIRSAPPQLGEHTNEILTELLGYSNERVTQLRAESAIA